MIFEENATIATNLSEAYPDRDDLARVLGIETVAQAQAEELSDFRTSVMYSLEALVNQLPADRLARLETWASSEFDKLKAAQPAEEPAQEVDWNRGDFVCSDCKRSFFAPHEGLFLDPSDETKARCIDCDLRDRGITE